MVQYSTLPIYPFFAGVFAAAPVFTCVAMMVMALPAQLARVARKKERAKVKASSPFPAGLRPRVERTY